jgi:hypothetical protein
MIRGPEREYHTLKQVSASKAITRLRHLKAGVLSIDGDETKFLTRMREEYRSIFEGQECQINVCK